MFRDRKDAGTKLGEALLKYKDENPLVVGIPRGGMETAYYVAQKLDAEMIPIISRKLGYPFNPEFAMGAVAEDGSLYISSLARSRVSEEQIEEILQQQKNEIKRRVDLLRKGQPVPEMKNRTVIVVDDGIATGATLFATLEMCKKLQPKKLIVAAPIGAPETIVKLKSMSDKTLILESPEDFYAVSQGYEYFTNLTDEEALEFINKHQEARKNQTQTNHN
ncbi:phosphoribosyltransferase [Algoriphagus sp. CAU 1675]|uniref:phosphoribosyltransferase n=1 Tax=Algoriphagus sp. CAU 1675 TaxID=3032597 RepID=UPI0023DB8DFA|nr:phosphoribosyltransferase [Algoriphagus sp. CAU 1675]MDF2157268.1 phosphoribosyltransferase [Algoriphagus sp. CAU 1675]